jgi:hypothetical protein
MADLEALRNRSSLATPRSSATLLPDPDRQELFCPIISVDDHYLEPLTMFDALPTRLRESAPRPIWDNEGVPYWLINGNKTPIVVTDGAVGRPISEWDLAPQKYEEFRTGVWEVSARVKDMDLNGVWASLNFPSTVWGFCGTQFARIPDRATGLACVRAYNDWVHEWCGSYPERFIASQLPWLADPVQAAHDIRVNAERGFKAVTFSENPESLGLPSLYSGEWDPFFAACRGVVRRRAAPEQPVARGGLHRTVSGQRLYRADRLDLRPGPAEIPGHSHRALRRWRVVGADGARAVAPGLSAARGKQGMAGYRPGPDRVGAAELLVHLDRGPIGLPDAGPDRN